MFIPLQHENNQGRRWPFITIAIVLLNIVVFLGTHWRMETQSPQLGEVRAHLVLLAALHPELSMPPDVETYVNTFKRDSPDLWRLSQNPNRDVEDGWDAKMRLIEDPAKLQAEMDSLAADFASLHSTSLADQYGFVPAHPTAASYITSMFLHGGWLHLIFNMWFLWLAGAILEDTWGRIVYPIFYLLAGIAATQLHAWTNPGSMVPAIGASGAIAGLMGAFLVRFPTTKIEIAVILGFRSLTNLALGKGIRFKAAAYWLLPLWLLTEILSGAITGHASGVAHWAHVGGFLFGAVFAAGLRYSGLEHRVNSSIEKKVTWTADEGYVKASEQMEQGKIDEALATLNAFLVTKPKSIEAYNLLQQILWRKNDIPAFRNAVVKLCQLHLEAHDVEAALQDYQEFTNSGGEQLPAAVWLELCRGIEAQQNFDGAVTEYARLAAACPTERPALLALLAAGRVSLKKLNRPSEALKFYKAAAASTVPHLDWESNIQSGIKDAEQALSTQPALK